MTAGGGPACWLNKKGLRPDLARASIKRRQTGAQPVDSLLREARCYVVTHRALLLFSIQGNRPGG